MKYTVEDVSPVVKKVSVELEAAEVNAAIVATVALYKTDAAVPGFRKGKVPDSLIEQRYQKHIYSEASQDLINAQISKILSETAISPIGSITFSKMGTFTRGKDFSFDVMLDVLPKDVTLPNYEGLEVTVKPAPKSESFLADSLKIIQKRHALRKVSDGVDHASEGQFVNIDFEFFSLKGKPLGIAEKNYEKRLDRSEFLPEFIDAIKALTVGEKKETKITFPENFFRQTLAGQTTKVVIQLNAIKDEVLLPIDDELAKSAGFQNLEEMKANLLKSEDAKLLALAEGDAKNTLVERLIKVADFPVPKAYISSIEEDYVAQRQYEFDRMGKVDKDLESYKLQIHPTVLMQAKAMTFLLLVAHKEGLDVSDQEVQSEISNIATKNGLNYVALRQDYENSGYIFMLRDRMLADKAADLIYQRAKVTVDDGSQKEETPKTETEKTETEKSTDAQANS